MQLPILGKTKNPTPKGVLLIQNPLKKGAWIREGLAWLPLPSSGALSTPTSPRGCPLQGFSLIPSLRLPAKPPSQLPCLPCLSQGLSNISQSPSPDLLTAWEKAWVQAGGGGQCHMMEALSLSFLLCNTEVIILLRTPEAQSRTTSCMSLLWWAEGLPTHLCC